MVSGFIDINNIAWIGNNPNELHRIEDITDVITMSTQKEDTILLTANASVHLVKEQRSEIIINDIVIPSSIKLKGGVIQLNYHDNHISRWRKLIDEKYHKFTSRQTTVIIDGKLEMLEEVPDGAIQVSKKSICQHTFPMGKEARIALDVDGNIHVKGQLGICGFHSQSLDKYQQIEKFTDIVDFMIGRFGSCYALITLDSEGRLMCSGTLFWDDPRLFNLHHTEYHESVIYEPQYLNITTRFSTIGGDVNCILLIDTDGQLWSVDHDDTQLICHPQYYGATTLSNSVIKQVKPVKSARK